MQTRFKGPYQLEHIHTRRRRIIYRPCSHELCSDIVSLIISFVVLQSASIFVLMKIIFHLAAFICVCSHQSQSHRHQHKLHVDSLTQVGNSQQNNWDAKKIIFIIINVASKRELCPYRRVAVTRFKTCGGDSQKISNLPP